MKSYLHANYPKNSLIPALTFRTSAKGGIFHAKRVQLIKHNAIMPLPKVRHAPLLSLNTINEYAPIQDHASVA